LLGSRAQSNFIKELNKSKEEIQINKEEESKPKKNDKDRKGQQRN
jgi:hypothetical protein